MKYNVLLIIFKEHSLKQIKLKFLAGEISTIVKIGKKNSRAISLDIIY